MIHPLAQVSDQASLADDVRVDAFAVIGPNVKISKGSWVASHAVISGPCTIGEHCQIYPFVSLGQPPQDLTYKDEATELVIGDHNIIRESATLHRGTVRGGGVTRIGDHNLIMAYCHIAHDCKIGSNVIFANNASLAGHVHIEDGVTLGGFTLVHQFCRVGAHAYTSMGAALNRDLSPFTLATGNYARAIGINKVGLQRRGIESEVIQGLERAFRLLVHRRGHRPDEPEIVALRDCYAEVDCFVRFIEESKRGIIRTGRAAAQ
jgi:UDP-N-acetylglucosamine acyltransferase